MSRMNFFEIILMPSLWQILGLVIFANKLKGDNEADYKAVNDLDMQIRYY